MSLNYVTLTLDLFDGQGNPVSQGWATLTPSVTLTDATDHQEIPQVPIAAQFRKGLTATVSLLATDNANVAPSGWGWNIAFTGVPGNPAGFSFFLPFAAGANQYLSAQAPVSSVVTQFPANPMTTLGDIIYENAVPVPARLAGNTSTALQVLGQTGTGSASAAPAWTAPSTVTAAGLAVKVLLPSGGDDTAAFNAALAALPTVTLNNGVGGTLAVPQGTIILGAGAFKFGSLGADTSNIGPCVNLAGVGRNATTANYWGAGDCFRMFNPLVANDRAFDQLPARHGIVNGFIIDGTNAQPGASGLHYGDTEGGVLGPDLEIGNFSQGLIAAPSGLGATAVGSGGTFAAGTYWWVVTALTRTGETVVSASASATLVLNGSANLAWSAVSGATGYRVYRNTSNSFTNTSYALVANLGAVTSYTDTGTAGYQTTAPPANISGNVGLWLDNAHAWTESIYGRVILRNNSTNVMCSVQTDGGVDVGPSFEYNDLTFKIYAWPKQNGLVLREGAWLENGSWKMRGNFANSNAAMQSAALVVTGCVPAGNIKAGQYSQIVDSRLDYQAETNSLASGSGTNYPQTIAFGDVNNNKIIGCEGILAFQLPANWTPSNWSQATSSKYSFRFLGTILGDANLNPANDAHIAYTGGLTLPLGRFPGGTQFNASSGDVFNLTLGANVTVAFDTNFTVAAPQRKSIIIAQPPSGGTYNYTVTWPQPGSPTLSSPAVYWPGGVPPVQSTGIGATDRYELVTADGIRWYGVQYPASIPVAAPVALGVPLSQLGLIAQNMPNQLPGSGTAPAAGFVNVIYVPLAGASVTITNAELYVNSAGSGLTSSQNFAAVYDNTGTRIGVTADQTTPWASTGLKQMALTGGPFTGTWPWVTVAFVSNGTTPPSFAAGGFVVLANAHASGAGLIFATNGSGATAMPASLVYSSNSVTNAHSYWAAVS